MLEHHIGLTNIISNIGHQITIFVDGGYYIRHIYKDANLFLIKQSKCYQINK